MDKPLSYQDKLKRSNREALYSLGALVFVALVWLLCGFGLADCDIQVFHLPLWVVASLLGTWAAAIIAAVVLSRLFLDFDLDDAPDAEAAVLAAPSGQEASDER